MHPVRLPATPVDALKSSYPSAYEPWDYEALTMETNRITLLHNPINTFQ